ncbi:unnamed protein product [Parascedosporium putredinis]|uniref:5-formyltetrahydrofolate cyclo-ligase n=1 Tax=Parascedosporium putredinis TaxID=1442378 RepID=A0A9P1GVA1_9PEZI|nr:unnamed protein product [Parascedosporium putredinis]CAI7987674.1 unnamed protein product [Parascedosporium putredinis]
MAAPLVAAKQRIRVMMKQKLATLSSDSIATQSRVLFESLQSFQPYKEAKRISVYLSMPGGEIQTDAIVRHALQNGKQVFVPYLHKAQPDPQNPHLPARVMDMVQLSGLADYESLKPDKWGIPSIDPATVNERNRILGSGTEEARPGLLGLDLIFMPGGFYDFFISRYSHMYPARDEFGRPSVLLYGLALKEQFLMHPEEEGIPVGPLDEPPHGIADTESCLLYSTLISNAVTT